MSWLNLVKIGRWEVAEKSYGLADKKTAAPPHRWADRVQNFANFVAYWYVYVYQIWSGWVAVCYYRKINFSDPESDYNIGWKPAM